MRAPDEAARRVIPGGFLTAAAILVLGAWPMVFGPPLIPASVGIQLIPVALGFLVLAAILVVVAWRWRRASAGDDLLVSRTPWAVGALAVPTGVKLASLTAGHSGGLRLVEGFLYSAAVGVLASCPDFKWLRWLTTPRLLIVAQAGILAWAAHHYADYIDVHVFLAGGVHRLVHGANPYSMTFPNIYGPFLGSLYYGAGVVIHGVVNYGFPYMPLSLLWALPSYLLGDVSYAGALGLGALAWALAGPSASRRSRAYAVLVVVMPGTVELMLGSWTETSIVALLGLAVWAIVTERLTLAAVLVGLLLVSKQYMIVALPCLWLLRPYMDRRRVALGVGTALVVTLPFVLLNVHAFWRSVVEWQFIQPFRPDSLSVLAYSTDHFAWPAPGSYGALSIGVGLAAAALFSWRVKPGAAQFATGIGLSILATLLFSKQAFINYYYLVGGAFLIAAWASEAVPDRLHPHTPRSAGGQARQERRDAASKPSPVPVDG